MKQILLNSGSVVVILRDEDEKLKAAGCFAYNHNLDTSSDHYDKIITTRTYDDRLQTLSNVRKAGLEVCSGGIIGKVTKAIDDNDVEIEIAPNIRIRLARASITEVRSKGEPVKDAPAAKS